MTNRDIIEKFEVSVAISNFEEQEIKSEHTLKNKKKGRLYAMNKKIVAGLSGGIILISGVVFAMNFERIKASFNMGKGVDKAVEDGYIAEPEMDYIGIDTKTIDETNGILLEDLNVETKISDFLMDDLNLSTHFDFKFDTKINEVIDLDKYIKMELKDLIVTDENKKILFCMDKSAFEEYCKESNLDYKYGETNQNVYNCGLNNFVERHYKETGSVQLTYNMYTGDVRYPKSKKLNFKFTQINLKEENAENTIIVKGNWSIDVDVPEKMYNRQSVSYKVVKNENPDFQITNATLYNTGFELGIIVSNIPKPEEPEILKELNKKYYQDKSITTEEYNKLINTDKEISKAYFHYRLYQSHPIVERDFWEEKEDIEKITYIENEEGQKFTAGMSPSRKQDGNFIDGNKYSFYETFDLTKNDASDKLKVRVMYYDKPYIIELERVEK